VWAVTAAYRRKTLWCRCALRNGPVVCIFARGISAPLTNLFKQIDGRIAADKDHLNALVVFLTDNPRETARKRDALDARCALEHGPLTLVSNPDGPHDDKIADDAHATIPMWKGPTVRVNRAYTRREMTEANVKDALLDLPKVLNG
jgi:hypothetical protein